MSSPPKAQRPPVVNEDEANKEQADMLLQRRRGQGYGKTLVAGAFSQQSGMGNTMGQNTKLGTGY